MFALGLKSHATLAVLALLLVLLLIVVPAPTWLAVLAVAWYPVILAGTVRRRVRAAQRANLEQSYHLARLAR
jgi:L-asparagine transporter-like permease